jgi:hypothetical protein
MFYSIFQGIDSASAAQHQPSSVVYSVELSRRGQPLGITIASTGDLFDPILISALAPGGLADRTGAIHTGNRLLAVNGDSLEVLAHKKMIKV